MIILAQAIAEYGGISSQAGGSGSLERLVDRLSNASTSEHVLLGVGLFVALFLLMKLLDAA